MAFEATRNPNTIPLAPRRSWWIIEDNIPLSEAASPGMFVEKFNDSGTIKLRKKSVTADQTRMLIVFDDPENNKTPDDDYAIGDMPPVGWVGVGFKFRAIVASGQDITQLDPLKAVAGGTMEEDSTDTAAANVVRFEALETTGAVTADTHLRVERVC